jgi:hypothetical protein
MPGPLCGNNVGPTIAFGSAATLDQAKFFTRGRDPLTFTLVIRSWKRFGVARGGGLHFSTRRTSLFYDLFLILSFYGTNNCLPVFKREIIVNQFRAGNFGAAPQKVFY